MWALNFYCNLKKAVCEEFRCPLNFHGNIKMEFYVQAMRRILLTLTCVK